MKCVIQHCVLLALFLASCDEKQNTVAIPTKHSDTDVICARSADFTLHFACDQWAFNHDAGHDTTTAERIISSADSDFRRHINETKYRDSVNNVIMRTRKVAAAGSFKSAEGKEFSFVIGTGQSGLVVCIWQRGIWTENGPPGRGIDGGIGIESNELRNTFAIETGTWIDKDKTQLRIPYRLQGQAGTITVQRSDTTWTFVPDRGEIGPGGWWKIDSKRSSTQP